MLGGQGGPWTEPHGGWGSLLIVLDDRSDPGHVFADLGIDPWNAFLSARPNRSPGNQTLKNSSTHQGASRVTLEDRSETATSRRGSKPRPGRREHG